MKLHRICNGKSKKLLLDRARRLEIYYGRVMKCNSVHEESLMTLEKYTI